MKRISPEEAIRLTEMPDEVADHYEMFWHDENVGVCGLHKLMFHYTVHVDMDHCGHRTRYCYAHPWLAVMAFDEWDGVGDPAYWHKHPDTSRRRSEIEFHGFLIEVVNGQLGGIRPKEEAHGQPEDQP